MKVVVQRVQGHTHLKSRQGDDVREAAFSGPGLVVLLGWTQEDAGPAAIANEAWLVERVEGLRVFPDKQQRMNLNLADYMKEHSLSDGGILWVSQFTLAASLESGFRPSFVKALAPDLARARYSAFVQRQSQMARPYQQIFGDFAAEMSLTFTNWGPVTIPLER